MSETVQSPLTGPKQRAYALDALRGLAILAMLLSGQLPFGEHALSAWMYHAQVPPPKHEWIGTLPGITWVDLVFPFFLFSLGAAIPLALSRRLEQREPIWKILGFILERGVLLGFFALYVMAIRPNVISQNPDWRTRLIGLLGFALLFPAYARLPEKWSQAWRWSVKGLGWAGAIALLALLRYPGDKGFSLGRSDIIIVVLANVAVFGSLCWWLTRRNVLLRLGILGVLLALRLSNMPVPIEGWVREVWNWSPAPWIYKLYYCQYLFIVIPGTIAGDLLLEWMKRREDENNPSWSKARLAAIAGLMFGFVLLLLIGLKARWLWQTTLLTFALGGLGAWLMRQPGNATERLFSRLFPWTIYWLVLGLLLEPYEGGIKKDKATLSYYFVTVGLALCVLIGFTILLDVFRKRRWAALLIDNGQNPMIAYAGINNLVLPLLALAGAGTWWANWDESPGLGLLKGCLITLLVAVMVSICTRCRIFWRS